MKNDAENHILSLLAPKDREIMLHLLHEAWHEGHSKGWRDALSCIDRELKKFSDEIKRMKGI